MSDAPRNADVTAIDYCQLLTLNKPDFQNFIGKHPELRARIDSLAADREAMNRLDPDMQPAPANGPRKWIDRVSRNRHDQRGCSSGDHSSSSRARG